MQSSYLVPRGYLKGIGRKPHDPAPPTSPIFLDPTIYRQFLPEHNSTCVCWVYLNIVLGSGRRTQPTGLSTLDSFLSKMSFVIRFMAFFSIFTGLIVLAAAVTTSRFQRVQESVLLRTLGASRKQITQIMIIEYVFLGGFAALTGLVLSYSSSWALAFFVFESVFIPTVLPFVVMISVVIGLTVLIGMLNSRGILDRPPLEVLRAEV